MAALRPSVIWTGRAGRCPLLGCYKLEAFYTLNQFINPESSLMGITVSKVHCRADGSEVKIVATAMYGAGLHLGIGTYVLCRKDASQPWRVAGDRPHPDWRKMSVADYVQRGRPEILTLTSLGERYAVAQELRRQLRAAEPDSADACADVCSAQLA